MVKNVAPVGGSKNSGVPKKVFIVEDHPVFREGLVLILRREPDLIVCGVAGDAEAALEAIPKAKPDMVLVDISLPGRNGLELIKELRAYDPGVKILVVSMHDEALYADRVLRAGGHGYIMKDEDPEELAQAIRDVLAGHIYVSEQVMSGKPGKSSRMSAEEEARPLDLLSDSELEVLELIGRGETASKIARHLKKSPKDISGQLAEIRRKLNLKTSNALLRYASCWVATGRA